MFCIAAFIILAIISIFSASHRKLAKQAFSCTLRRVTLRPCDSSFKEETKNKILSHVANKTPKLVKTADIGIEVASFALVVLTIWSFVVALQSGLNLFVWGTCTPANASSCSISSETCSIDKVQKSFWDLTMEGKPHQWFINEIMDFGNTVANIPTRLQVWDANDYLPENVTYKHPKDNNKPTALEIIDPGCIVCGRLFNNIEQSNFADKYNLAYLAYPIKNPNEEGKFNYKNSYLITTYLESMKINPLDDLDTPADWQILERIFTWKTDQGTPYQIRFNSSYSPEQTTSLIKSWMKDIGYSDTQITKIADDASSKRVADIIKTNHKIVETQVKTVSIPTIIFNGRRHDGLVKVQDLN